MASTKHTPGPWMAREATASSPTTHVYGPNGHIASFTGRRHREDATIAAAAPDLKSELARLREIVSDFVGMGCIEPTPEVAAALHCSGVALAKAEGRTCS